MGLMCKGIEFCVRLGIWMVSLWASGMCNYWSGYLVVLSVSGWLREWKAFGVRSPVCLQPPLKTVGLLALSTYSLP